MRAVIVSHLFGTGSLVSEWLELYKVAFVWGDGCMNSKNTLTKHVAADSFGLRG